MSFNINHIFFSFSSTSWRDSERFSQFGPGLFHLGLAPCQLKFLDKLISFACKNYLYVRLIVDAFPRSVQFQVTDSKDGLVEKKSSNAIRKFAEHSPVSAKTASNVLQISTENQSEIRKRDELKKIVEYLEKKIKTKKRSVADDLLLEKLAKLVEESPDLIPDLLPDNIESKEEMGKMIADQLTEISPVLEKEDLENVIGSKPILVLHPHVGEDADNDRTNSQEHPTKEESLLEKLAKLIADKPDLIQASPEIAPEISPAEVEKTTSVKPSNNPGDKNGHIDKIIAERISDTSPILKKDELEKAIESMPILVLPPKNGTDHKSEISPESFPENSNGESDILDKSTGEIDTFVESGDEFSEKDLDLYDKLVKEGHEDHAHTLNLLIEGDEHGDHSNADESIIDTSMTIKQNEVEHQSEANKHDVAKIDGKETGSDRQSYHVHFRNDLENPDEFIYERDHHKDHNHFYDDIEKADQRIKFKDPADLLPEKKQGHPHIVEDGKSKDEQIVNKEQDHKHFDENIDDTVQLLPEPSKNHQHIVEDLEDQSDNEQQINRKKYHKHVDENADELADYVEEQSQNKEHHHITDDLENDEIPQINRKQHHKHVDEDDLDDLAEYKAEQQQNHNHLTEGYDSNDGPVFDEVVDFSGVSAILEESSDIVFGKELSSTPTTLALQLLLQRDTLSTSVK